jgi:antitoxin (DNA-binding transcriptional repressor) of toxin-antitoxin stability system
MTSVGLRDLSHHTSRYLAQVKAGRTLAVTDRGRVVAVISPPPGEQLSGGRPRPRIGGYRSARPLTAEEIDADLTRGFGDDRRR